MELRKIRFDETFAPGQIEFASENLEQVSPLHAVGSAELLKNTDGEVRVQGRYTVEFTAPCDRCLVNARHPLDAGFDLFYQPAAVIARDEEIEIDEGEAEIGFYEGNGLELEDILREQILLALPMQRVCSEDCKGICPVCGNNRNQSACDCHTHPADDRWGALPQIRDLRIKQ
jgi:uncharacterized protein